MLNDLSKIKYISLISGIASLLLGIYVLTNPAAIAEGMGLLFCIVVLIEGISQILNYMGDRSEARSIWRLFEGIFSVIIAICLILGNTSYISLGLIFIFGIWLIVNSVLRLLMSGRLLKYEKNIGQRLMFVSIIELVLGIIIALRPGVITVSISLFVAIALFAQAIVGIFRFFRLNRLERKMR